VSRERVAPGRRSLAALAILLAAALAAAYGCTRRDDAPRAHIPLAHSPLEFTLADIGGKPYPLEQHRGQVLLLVNVASQCHFTGQYKALQALHERYRERGLVVIGVPANDFLGQEPGSEAEISRFCSATYGVTFPLMAKVGVRGQDICPLYQHLTSESARPGKIAWNFTKFVVGRDGLVAERFGPTTAPDDPRMIAVIEQALGAR
jgi:glutathione peroxidase